ncbi:hypothetical protein ACOSQ3_028369 [Xanthoceras sorbifolium]
MERSQAITVKQKASSIERERESRRRRRREERLCEKPETELISLRFNIFNYLKSLLECQLNYIKKIKKNILGINTIRALLSRVFDSIRENNPELAGERRRTVMRPPQVLREGTKKTVFVNFMEHVMTFLLAEMGTSGSLDGQKQLVVKDRFASKNVEGILHRYINEYVLCNSCRSLDTILIQRGIFSFFSDVSRYAKQSISY